MRITVRTRSQNKILYKRMRRFIPENIEAIAHTGYSSWKHASIFLHDAIETTDDILLVLDEDAYIVNWAGVENICQHVKDNQYTHAGVPDGGVIHHRTHSFLNINPFFAVFNCALIKPLKTQVNRKEIDATTFEPEMERLKPDWITSTYSHDTIEPFAGLFYWLAKVGRPLFLHATTLKDQISTRVKGLQEEPLCLHSWYSRSYQIDDTHTQRIDRIYKAAVREKRIS